MRILQIGAALVGAQKEIEEGIHNYLVRQGHESFILFADGDSSEDNIIKYENSFESLVRRGLRKYFGKKPRHAMLGTARLIRQIRLIKPDLVHIHVLHHGYIDYIALFKYLSKIDIPVVYSMHDFWAATGGCYYYTTAGCDRFRSGCEGCPLCQNVLDCSASKTRIMLEKKLAFYAELSRIAFVAVSSWVHEELLASKIAKYPIYTVYNSISIDSIPDYQYCDKRDNRFIIIGVAANWDERKGILRFCKLAEILGDTYRIILVGTVSDEIKRNAPSNMSFPGQIVDRNELYRLYAQADILASMSFEETFGLTFIEAAFVGTKAIGFNSSAIPSVLKKTYGFVVDNLDVNTMANCIKRLYINREECRLNAVQIDEIRSFFSKERMGSEYEMIYHDVLNDKN